MPANKGYCWRGFKSGHYKGALPITNSISYDHHKLGDCLSNSWSQCFVVIKKVGDTHLQGFNRWVLHGHGHGLGLGRLGLRSGVNVK